ncbi:MAG: hypothetical protein ACTSQU_17425, partial [Promethearchaeota archaeon]
TPVLAISSSIERNDIETIERMEEYVSLHTTDREQVKRLVESFVEPWNIVNWIGEENSQLVINSTIS